MRKMDNYICDYCRVVIRNLEEAYVSTQNTSNCLEKQKIKHYCSKGCAIKDRDNKQSMTEHERWLMNCVGPSTVKV